MSNETNEKIVSFPGAAAAAPVDQEAARPAERKLPQCAIGYVHKTEVTAGFSISLVKLIAGDAAMPNPVFGARILDHGAPPYLNLARNALVAEFLKVFGPEVEALLVLDADNTFDPEQAYHLAAMFDPIERPVVGGLYFAWSAEKYFPRPVLHVNGKTMWDYPGSALVEVDSLGMGFTLISRKWLEEWKAKHGETWFDFRGTGRASEGGFAIEDRAFCERVRSTGHKIYVHTGIKIGHEKLVNVNEKLYAALSLLRERARQPVPIVTPEGRD